VTSPECGSNPWDDRHVVLVGLMGAGKSTVGRLLAQRLDRRLSDSDQRIEALTGRTVKVILATDGVDALRRHEAAALFDVLTNDEPLVVAAAGGVVLAEQNRRRLMAAHVHVVWLDGDPEILATRTPGLQHRPWLDDDAAGTLQRMYQTRRPLYREVADTVVRVDGLTPDEIADRIVG
jgi:shikimate kinase